MLAVLRRRQFRLLFTGHAVSQLGDQFHLIALPWLVLTLTHDPLQLGGVLAVAGIPRALLMLVGGVFADRHSPRLIMLASDALRFVLTAALAAAILTGNAQLWMVYVLAGAFGVVSGFFMPAAEATVPRVLDENQLEGGNAMMMGIAQLAGFVGPVTAGLLIAAFGAGARVGGEQAASLTGIGMAFSVDAVSFLVSAVCLALMSRIPVAASASEKHPVADLGDGLRYAFGNPYLRVLVIVVAFANFLIAGPMLVGLPVLSQERLGGAAAFGVIMSAYAVTSLLGMLTAGTLPRPAARKFGWIVVALLGGFAIAVGAIGYAASLWVAAALMAAAGLGNGYIAIVAMTAVQRMTGEEYLGRVMSLVTLAMVGLMPVSQALSGAIVRISPETLFVGAGAGFALLAAWSATQRHVWALTAPTPETELNADAEPARA